MSNRREVLKAFEEQKEYTTERVNKGIDKNRKGICEITVKDSSGIPVPDVKISVTQKTHEFRFGANLFMLEELETEEKNKLYKKYFADVFNMATLPFYWNGLEPTPGNRRFAKDSERIYRRPAIDLCIEFCKENGIEPREHCLNYDTWIPDWLVDEPVSYIKEKLEERMMILAERYSEDINCWEVINESLFTRIGEKCSAFYHEPDFVGWSFDTAAKYFKNNELAINDAQWNVWADAFNYNRSAYYMQIERELKSGAKIDAIGMQFHMFYNREDEKEKTKLFYEPKHLYDVMDTYAEFEKPLQITEVTIPAYSNDNEDEQIQADILERLYSIWFSHPNMEQIIYWNLVDGYAAYAPQGDMTVGENYYYGGLIRFDMTPKPAYFRIKDLICKKWHTEEAVVTDGSGKAEFRGFFGKYRVEIMSDGKKTVKEIDFKKRGNNRFEVVI